MPWNHSWEPSNRQTCDGESMTCPNPTPPPPENTALRRQGNGSSLHLEASRNTVGIFSSEPQSPAFPLHALPWDRNVWLPPWSPAWLLLSHNDQPPRMENPLEGPGLAVSGMSVALLGISAQGHPSYPSAPRFPDKATNPAVPNAEKTGWGKRQQMSLAAAPTQDSGNFFQSPPLEGRKENWIS